MTTKTKNGDDQMIHIKDEAVAIADDVIALRRYFHMHPELEYFI